MSDMLTEEMPLTPAEEAALSAPAAPGAPNVDAPFGFLPNGQPRKRREKVPGGRRNGARTARAAGTAPAPGPGRPKGSTAAPTVRAEDVAKGATQLPQLLAAGLLMAGSAAAEPLKTSLSLDAVTIALNGEALSEGLTTLADVSAPVRRVLAWLGETGPYAALVGAVVAIGAQVATNHGIIPPGALQNIGVETLSAPDLVAKFADQQDTGPA
jgi:hypothetical protein